MGKMIDSAKGSTGLYLAVIIGSLGLFLGGVLLIGGQFQSRGIDGSSSEAYSENNASSGSASNSNPNTNLNSAQDAESVFRLRIITETEGLSQQEQLESSTEYDVPTKLANNNLMSLLEAFAAQSSAFSIDVQEFSFGKMITGVNGVSADSSSEFWEILLNGQQAQVGASELVVKPGDEISLALKGF